MKKYILLFTLIFATYFAHSKTIEICPTCVQTSIQGAINSAQEGDLLLIKKGTYKEGNIIVSKSLHLKGENFPIIDGENKNEVITVTANDVTIEGLQVQNVGTSYLKDRAGIRIRKSKNFKIKNNRLFNTFFGIYLEHSNNGVIEGNEVIGQAIEEMSSGNAIHLWYCKNIKVENNLVRKHRDGIYLEFVDNSLLRNNKSEDNLRYGLHFMFSNDDDYFNNEFRRNGAGVAVMFSKRINMWENTFEFNWGKASYGILLKEIYDAEIKNNVFRENTIGIYVEGSTRINYFENDFIRNGWALKISGGCLDNKVTENNFISNSFDLAFNSAINNNTFDGNYWSDYSGYDLDKDGIGDVPYRPVKLFNYVVNKTPEAMVLLRSLFVDIINFSEKVSPIFTPKNVVDNMPRMLKF
ncbi:MAG: nitrous oxide reductase family maturation protein NosD [Bacteroidetes bacterium]|jgi:nitrous oxidase accessory protein|nr:nitrous oxide reductase family maturation protein NosD [Bacteroidota bacterium]MDF1867116.1 nitrous oxide reductase family maturation protein NosD [Saprospiraceae bacterium]